MDLSKLSDQELDNLLQTSEGTKEKQGQNAPDLSAIPEEDLDAIIAGFAPRDALEKAAANTVQNKGYETAEEKDFSEFGAGAMGFTQGITFGGADEIGGAAKTAYDVLSGEASLSQVVDQYKLNRDGLRAQFKDAEEEWGGAYTAGDLAGSFTTALIPGVGAAGQTMRGAVALGATAGVLRSDADTVYEDIQNAVIGGAAGGVFAGAARGIARGMRAGGRAAQSVGSDIQSKAKSQILLSSMGADDANPTQLKTFLKSKGLGNLQTIEEVSEEIGLSKAKTISSPQQVSELVKRHLNAYGSQMDEIINTLDLTSGPSINPIMLMREIRNQPNIQKFLKSNLGTDNKIAEETIQELIGPVSDGQMWTARELWGFKKRVFNFSRKLSSDLEGGVKREILGEVDNSLKSILDDVVSTSYGGSPVDAKLFRDASNKYHTLKKMTKLISENMEIQASGPMGGVRKAISNYSNFIQPTNVASGIAFGPMGYATSLILTQAGKIPKVQSIVGSGLIKAGKFAEKNQNYAKKLIQHAGYSQGAFETTLAAGEAMFDFSANKLPRSSSAVKEDAAKVLNLVKYHDNQLGEQLQEALENDDEQLIAGIMTALANTSTGKNFIAEGIGWDGKAISEGDIISVQQMIDRSPISSIKKAKLKQQFQLDKKIPVIEEEKPFYKVYDPRLKTKRMM